MQINDHRQPDWSIDNRKQLYRAVRSLIESGMVTWREVLDGALPNAQLGKGYEDNFRSGRISRKNAASIYRWAATHHPAALAAAGLTNFRESPAEGYGRWRRFLELHGASGLIAIRNNARFRRSSRQSQEQQMQKSEFAIPKVAQYAMFVPFRYQLATQWPCHVLGFQGYQGTWRSIPLSERAEATIAPHENVLPKPFSEHGEYQDNPLVEETEPGVHELAFLLSRHPFPSGIGHGMNSSDPLSPDLLGEVIAFATDALSTDWKLLTRSVLFAPSTQQGPRDVEFD